MSDKRIYELTEASVVGADDLLALDSSEFSETKKIKMSTLTKGLVYKESLTNLIINSDTNNTGSTITKGTVFYLYGELCIALVDIASGAEFTPDTNYDNITVGGQITEVKSALGEQSSASGVTGDDAFSKIGTLDTRTKQRNIGVTLNSTGNEYFTHELTRSMVSNGIYIVWFRVVAKKAVTTIDVDMNIGTVSVPPQYQILGYVTNIDATLMEGSVLISANSNIYLRFTNTLPIGRALVVTAIGTYL